MAIKNIPDLAAAAALAGTDLVPITQGVDVPVKATMGALADFAVSRDGDLAAIAALTGTGIARRTGIDTWALLDYETGTFIPTVGFTTDGDFSPTYSAQIGRYQRIGSLVHYTIELEFDTNAYTTASGVFEMRGLPLTAAAGVSYYPGQPGRINKIDTATGTINVAPVVQSATNKALLSQMRDATVHAFVLVGGVLASTAGCRIEVSGWYPV